MQNLKGKVALVTGAARRIGAATVEMLHEAGATVVIHYRASSEDAIKLSTKLNTIRDNSCLLQQAELSNIEELSKMVDEVIEQTGRLDILVNNASSFFPTPVGEITEMQWNTLMGSNLKGPLFLSQLAAPHLKKNQGCIVNMVDIHGIRPLKDYMVYSIAKAGLLMMTQSLARELGPEVRVNGIAPGAILWPENESKEMKAEHNSILEKTCLKRLGTPKDITKAILFLVKDADYITGHIIPVDGGRLLNH